MRYLILIFLLAACSKPKGEDNFYFPCSTPDSPDVKRILIIGDSISIGYSPHVINELCSQGHFVTRINVNGGPASKGLANIDSWLGGTHWDLVTFNFGYWDMVRPDIDEEVKELALEQYAEKLPLIAEKIKLKSDKAIFFTTTSPHNSPYHSDISAQEFNSAAIDALTGIDNLTIYDLHAESVNFYNYLLPDGYHYNVLGYSELGQFVIESILTEI